MSHVVRSAGRLSALAAALCLGGIVLAVYVLTLVFLAVGIPVGGIFMLAAAPGTNDWTAGSPAVSTEAASSGFSLSWPDLGQMLSSLQQWTAVNPGLRVPLVSVGLPLAVALIAACLYASTGRSLSELLMPPVPTHDADGNYRKELPTVKMATIPDVVPSSRPVPAPASAPVARTLDVPTVAPRSSIMQIPLDRLYELVDKANQGAQARPTPGLDDPSRFGRATTSQAE